MLPDENGVVIGNVQDAIADGGVKNIFKPKDGVVYLHASGREDIDVRMLGEGRPFIMEVVNPTRAITGHKMIQSLEIEGPHVFCKNFKVVDKYYFDRMKEIESMKAKSYASVMHSQQKLTQEDCLKLNQIQNLEIQ